MRCRQIVHYFTDAVFRGTRGGRRLDDEKCWDEFNNMRNDPRSCIMFFFFLNVFEENKLFTDISLKYIKIVLIFSLFISISFIRKGFEREI